MPKFDEFDLDVKPGVGSENDTKIRSIVLCTPGTCHPGCKETSTLNSNCCLPSIPCSFTCK